MSTQTPERIRKRASGGEGSCCGARPLAPVEIAPERAEALARRLRVLGDATRLRMLDLLARQEAPLCVCDVTSAFPLSQPTISHHLRLLREEGLIEVEKRGVWSYYRATDEGARALALVRAGL